MENLNESSTNTHFKEYLKSILEDSNTPYFQKADYIGLSLQEIASKIEYIGTDIRELQAYKKKLQTALTLAKELVADVLYQMVLIELMETIYLHLLYKLNQYLQNQM